MSKEHIYIDLEALLIPDKTAKLSFKIPSDFEQCLMEFHRANSAVRWYIFYIEEDLALDNSITLFSGTKDVIKKISPTDIVTALCEQYRTLFSTTTLSIAFYRTFEIFDKTKRLDSTHLVLTKSLGLRDAACCEGLLVDCAKPTPPSSTTASLETSAPAGGKRRDYLYSTAKFFHSTAQAAVAAAATAYETFTTIARPSEPFSLNQTEFDAAKERIKSAVEQEKSIYILLDFDDTIIKLNECLQQKTVVLNPFLIEKIVELLNNLDDIRHIQFAILSARADDYAGQATEISISAGLAVFVSEINKKIKRSLSIKIEKSHIYCLQYFDPTKDYKTQDRRKMILTAAKKDAPNVVVARALIFSSPPREVYDCMVHGKDLSEYVFSATYFDPNAPEFDICKSLFLQHYFMPKKMQNENTLVVMFDDNDTQLKAINKLRNPRILTVSVTPAPPAAATLPYTDNTSAPTSALVGPS